QVWPYFNADAYNSVTMYNGVENSDNWSWPSAYMAYENSFDSVNSGYLYVRKDGTAQFNATINYLDKDGVEHELYLSDVAGRSGDFPAGTLEEFFDVGSYIRNLGHAPASGNVKFTKVTYFVIGAKDNYVKLYDMKFTPKFDIPDPYKTLMNSEIEQLSGAGSYAYDNGTLTMQANDAGGYSVKMNVNETVNPTDMTKLLMDVNATAPFNVTLELTNANGDATVSLKNEYFNVFNMDSGTAEALPAGAWNVVMNLLGYYEWNGGAVTSSTIKSVTFSLEGEGTLTLKALQASRNDTPVYVQDGQSSVGSLNNSSLGDINGDTVVDSTDVRLLMREMVEEGSLHCMQLALADYNGDGKVNTADARAMLLVVIGG
ncbi:MAG: dockerin type I repeat-containing protein, partial [Clostridia bacterium]|nr:dockerin type I repeat-containing protein [Clostridia bacterium]